MKYFVIFLNLGNDLSTEKEYFTCPVPNSIHLKTNYKARCVGSCLWSQHLGDRDNSIKTLSNKKKKKSYKTNKWSKNAKYKVWTSTESFRNDIQERWLSG